MSMDRHNQKSHAFTLIELLVVFSIISLLISILLPALGKARKSSRSILCQSNIKQIGVWGFTYAADNKGILPTHGDTSWAATWGHLTDTYWYQKSENAGLYKGWGNIKSIHCPEARIQVSPIREVGRVINYAINQYMGGKYDHGSRGKAPLPRMELLDSKGYWFTESPLKYYTTPAWDFDPVISIPFWTTQPSLYPWAWRNTKYETTGHPDQNASFLFGDGHGKQISHDTFEAMSTNERKTLIAYPF